MAEKVIRVSDLSGKDIPEGRAARIVVHDHPSLGGGAVQLDAEIGEVEALEASQRDLVTLDVLQPGRAPRRVVMEVEAFNALFPGNVDEALAGAPRVGPRGEGRRARAPRRATGGRTARVDYTAPDRFGQLHRGRITEEEAELVRANREQASANREAQGHPPINWDDPKEKTRYGL